MNTFTWYVYARSYEQFYKLPDAHRKILLYYLYYILYYLLYIFWKLKNSRMEKQQKKNQKEY